MAIFCIPQNLVQKLKDSALKGEVNIKELYKMSSGERRAYFEKFTDKNLGEFLNKEFEKAMISKQQTALVDWAKSVFSPEAQQKPVFKTVLDKINSLDEMGVLNPKTERAFLQDLVTDRLGIRVTPEEVRAIAGKAKKIQEAQKVLGDGLGDPTKAKENIDFFKAKKEMDDYLQSVSPASKLKVITGTIGRGMMLASVKSPVLNIGSNAEVGFTESVGRRLASGQFKGADNGLALDYIKMVNKVYQATGYDLSRMMSLSDTGASGARVLGQDTVHAQGSGAVRATGRVVEDIVFKQMMGAPDVAFSSFHFADSVNLGAMKMAKGDISLAREYMKDAMRIDPKTPQGEVLRNQGIMDAQVATWTNKTWGSRVSEGIRKILNDVSGDARLGDFLMPFVKTPANVIATGIDYAGMGFAKAGVDVVKAIREGELTPERARSLSRNLVRAGLGLTGAAIIAYNLKKEDFVGAYDPRRAQIEQLRNSNTNSVRIGNKWISLDWFGPLSVPLTAMLYAKTYGESWPEKFFQYFKGIGSAIGNLPGIQELSDFFSQQQSKQNQTLGGMATDFGNYTIDQLSARLMPGLISDFARATDQYNRVGSTGAAGFKAKVPGLRQQLPIKTNIFGEPSKTEPALSTILFGSRVKTDKETAITTELGRLADSTGKSVQFTDWDKTSSASISDFRQKVGEEKFQEAKKKYGEYLKARVEEVIAKQGYKDLSDEDKLAAVNALDSEVTKKVYSEYGFKPQKSKSKKANL